MINNYTDNANQQVGSNMMGGMMPGMMGGMMLGKFMPITNRIDNIVGLRIKKSFEKKGLDVTSKTAFMIEGLINSFILLIAFNYIGFTGALMASAHGRVKALCLILYILGIVLIGMGISMLKFVFWSGVVMALNYFLASEELLKVAATNIASIGTIYYFLCICAVSVIVILSLKKRQLLNMSMGMDIFM